MECLSDFVSLDVHCSNVEVLLSVANFAAQPDSPPSVYKKMSPIPQPVFQENEPDSSPSV